MPSSALEDFVRDLKKKFLFWVKNQDRFVLIGLIFSVIPIPPSFLIGLFIGSINLFLFLTGKLERRHFNLILLTIFISIFNLLLTGYIYFSIYKTFWMLDIFRVGVIGFAKNYFSLIERFLFWVLDFVRNFFLGHDKMAQTV